MKKYMMALFAAAVAAIGYGDGISSDNIVGYTKSDTVNGFTIVTPQFQNIADENFSLLSFNPGEEMYDKITVNQIDQFGTSIHTYSWTAYARGEDGKWNQKGWADDEGNLITDPEAVKFIPGESVIVSGDEGGLTAAGQVRKEDVTIQLRNGFTLTGNPFPVAIAVQDILPSSAKGIEDTYDQISLNLINNFGTAINTYSWTAYARGNDGKWNQKGWADDTGLLIDDDNDIKLLPGEGVQVSGSSSDHYLLFRAPEL